MSTQNYQDYKPSKKIKEQLDYLEEKKRVRFIDMDRNTAGDKLLEYNYINVITPFKHKFAKCDSKKQVVKVNGNHIYEKDVDFSEYYNCFWEERKKYPIIIANIQDFEIHFKSITAYHILTTSEIYNSSDLSLFLSKLELRFSYLESRYDKTRIQHMKDQIESLKKDIFNYADVYCFFDRMSLGNMLTVFTCLEDDTQNRILKDMKRYKVNLNVDQVPDFIKKVFCLVSIRNCVMHCNSLEVLIRFYKPKTHELRNSSDRRKYVNLIKLLSKEKTHD
ncbi:Abi family protein [Catenibacterium mitsuokai]|uniref:Abi family protein n=1 Tax=Catenibacterium mitsuokai TaxID=100886 RepID=UPI003D784B9D